MGKKKEKRVKNKKKLVNPISALESKLPNIPINLFVIIPFCVGLAVGVSIFDNVPLSLLFGLALTGVVWFGKGYLPEKPAPKILPYTPDDLVLGIFEFTWFTKAVPADVNRPEAYSVDGERWSHKLELSTDYGDSDIFIVRGSLETGVSWLEYVEGESKNMPDFWEVGTDDIAVSGESLDGESAEENLEYDSEYSEPETVYSELEPYSFQEDSSDPEIEPEIENEIETPYEENGNYSDNRDTETEEDSSAPKNDADEPIFQVLKKIGN